TTWGSVTIGFGSPPFWVQSRDAQARRSRPATATRRSSPGTRARRTRNPQTETPGRPLPRLEAPRVVPAARTPPVGRTALAVALRPARAERRAPAGARGAAAR